MARSSDERRRASAPEKGERSPLERWIEPLYRDSTLWPIALVLVAVFVTLGASALLLAFAEGNRFALGAVLLLAGISIDVAVRERRRGRFGPASRGLVGYWLLTAASAWAAARAGWL